MKAEIVAIGTELLLGHVVNTNASYLSRKLAGIGIDVYHHTTVGDNPERITAAVRDALGRADIVITTGGLGPTVDDITVATIARLTGRPIVLNKTVLKDLKDYFKLRKVRFPADNVQQAYIPEGVKWIRNRVGTAPGLIMEWHEKLIICLPGPPREIEPMFEKDIIPYLLKSYPWPLAPGPSIIKCRTIKITGLPESLVNNKVKDLLKLKPPTTVGIYAKLRHVELRIMSKARSEKAAAAEIKKIEDKIRARLKDYIFGVDDETLEYAAGKALTRARKTVAIAESCTGGLIASRLTDVSGASKYFKGGVITYSNECKEGIVGVPMGLIKKHGAVSKQVALAMAKGVKNYICTDIGIGVTGIAGPTGGTKSKPVGLVYIALVTDRKQILRELRFKGSRQDIKYQASQVALDLIRRNI